MNAYFVGSTVPDPAKRTRIPPQLTSKQQELSIVEEGLPYPSQLYGPTKQLVTKNIYVHLPPPEVEEKPFPIQAIKPSIPKKHYKILFIKAPNPPEAQQVKIPPIIQDEHKTLVYVLFKSPIKPNPTLELPTPTTTTEASHPEVFFIKYKENKLWNQYGSPQ